MDNRCCTAAVPSYMSTCTAVAPLVYMLRTHHSCVSGYSTRPEIVPWIFSAKKENGGYRKKTRSKKVNER